LPSLNQIFLTHVFILIAINIGVYYLLDHLIVIDIDHIQDKEKLKDLIETKFLLLFIATSLLHILMANKIASEINREIEKIDRYLKLVKEKMHKHKIKLKYSREFYNIGVSLTSLFKKLYKMEKKKRKFNAKLRVVNLQQEKLLGAISHELKNPISSIIGYSQILKDELKSLNIEKTHIRFIDKIISNSKRIDELLNRLRLAVQLENNKFELRYQAFDLSKSIRKIVDDIETNFNNREIEVDVPYYELYADKTLIELVLINLIENGLKYSDGKIIIKLEEDCLKVIDFGVGIDEAELSYVTKRFYRVDKNSYKESMGLGLAIVSYILKLHNLKLDIDSQVGRGSTFSIKLLPIKNRELPKEIKPLQIS